jgi:hypothetical protein
MSIEMWSLGSLDPEVGHDMYIDLLEALSANVLSTIITFIPISCGGRVHEPNKWHFILRSPPWAATIWQAQI